MLTISALERRGMDEVWRIIEDHRTRLEASGELARKRRQQQHAWLWSMLDDGLKAQFLAREDVRRLLPEMEAAVEESRVTPTQAARRLLALLEEATAKSTAAPRRRGSGSAR